MNKKQEDFFAMTLKVRNFALKNALAIATIPAIPAFFTQHSTLVNVLITADTGSRVDLTGFAIAKANKRNVLEVAALKVSNAVTSLSVINNDAVMQKKADFPSSKWYLCSEEELVTQATIVRNLATPLGVTLAPYGAAVVDITALTTAINTFTDVITDPTLAIDQRKEDNIKVVATIGQMQTLLNDKLDVLMRSFEVSNSSLYGLYRSARAIDQSGSVTAPTVVVDLAPATTITVATATVYNADTFYTLQNMGALPVQFSLSTTTDVEGPEIVVLNAGETRSRLAENLAPMGLFLVVKNANAVPVKVKVWVE